MTKAEKMLHYFAEITEHTTKLKLTLDLINHITKLKLTLDLIDHIDTFLQICKLHVIRLVMNEGNSLC